MQKKREISFALGTLLVAGLSVIGAEAKLSRAAENLKQSDTTAYKITPDDIAKKNPVAATPEGLADARKFYGYSCAMCHGKAGDGKGDLAEDMKLTLHDWRDASSIEKVTDGELFYIITNGKGKMPGEGDRSPEKQRWNLVNLVRAFAKKGADDKPKSGLQQ
jgi:mono/diheme cytochrome c family protein